MRTPADELAWDTAIRRACRLRPTTLGAGDTQLRLFANPGGTLLTNAPYLEYGGIRTPAAGLEPDTVQTLWAELKAHKLHYIVLKSRSILCAESTHLRIDQRYVTFDLDLSPGSETLWQEQLAGKTRNQVRKARRHGFRAVSGGHELLDDFYQVIAQCWRDLGTPTHSRAFFHAIAQSFGPACRFQLLFDAHVPIAAALLLEVEGSLHHPFAGTIRRYKPTSANNLLYWNLITEACARGLRHFEMGRSLRDSGTWHYKRSWGAQEAPLYYHYLLGAGRHMPERDTALIRLATSCWRYLPLGLSRALGPHLIRHVL